MTLPSVLSAVRIAQNLYLADSLLIVISIHKTEIKVGRSTKISN